jgi:hypothetical protein
VERYRKYFLQHSLWLEDGFCSYYVQDSAWGRQEILDVEAVTFDWADDAERWLHQCADHDHSRTLNRLRAFLADHCRQYYHLHRMNDRQVLSAAAREMTRRTSPVVIEPRMGWAVLVDAHTAQPVQPISVEPAPDMDGLLSELRRELDFLVAERQKEYDAYEVRLSQMSDVEKAALYGKSGAGAFIENTVGSIWDIAKALPGFYPTYLKALWRVVSTPARMAAATARSITTGDLNPLQKEIDAIVNPMALTWEQAVRFKSILTVLFGNPDTCHLLHDFSQRYWDATHPVERTKMAVNAASDILLTILLAIFTAGIGAAANVAAKSGRLIRVARLLERVALTLKKISPRSRLTGKARKAAGKLGIGKKARSKAKKGIRDVKSPKAVEKLDDTPKKRYGTDDKDAGKKKTTNKKYKNKPPTKEEINLAKKSGKTAKQIAAREKVAAHYYEKQGFDPDTIPAHLEGVDFNHPVEITKLTEGTKLKQLKIPGAPQGNYYTTPDTPANRIGISLKVMHRKTGEIIDRIEGGYIVKRDTKALSSTAADILDNWSIPGKDLTAKGGGKQFFSTDKVSITPLE